MRTLKPSVTSSRTREVTSLTKHSRQNAKLLSTFFFLFFRTKNHNILVFFYIVGKMARAKGFCDLNIPTTATYLKETVLNAVAMGYQTIAINYYVTDTMEDTGGSDKKKRKVKGQGRLTTFLSYSLG